MKRLSNQQQNIYLIVVHAGTHAHAHTHTHTSARNKNQKLVDGFFEDRIFYRLLIAVLLKIYRKFVRPKWILVSQMLKLVGKWPMADLFLALHTYTHIHTHTHTSLHMHVRTHSHTTYACACTHTHTPLYMHAHVRMHTHMVYYNKLCTI